MLTDSDFNTLEHVDGGLGRPLPLGRVPIALDVQVTDDAVDWRETGSDYAPTTPGLLDDFLKLAESDPECIGRFVARWGGINFCSCHSRPEEPRFLPNGHGNDNDVLRCRTFPVETESGFHYSDPLAGYPKLALQARAILRLAQKLQVNEPGETRDWDIALPSRRGSDWTLVDEKQWLGLIVSLWLSRGRIAVFMEWLGDDPTVRFGGDNLFGHIALQLAWAVSAHEGLVQCSTCGYFFTPKRRPRLGQNRYCNGCKDRGRDVAEAKRRHALKRQFGLLQARGRSEEQIAASHDTTSEVVLDVLTRDRRSRTG